MTSDEDPRYEAAKKRVKDLKDFYGHVFAYVVVNLFLFILNMIITPQAAWSVIVILFWGIGLAFHAWDIYGFGDAWEERKIAELMGETHKRKNSNSEDYFDLTKS